MRQTDSRKPNKRKLERKPEAVEPASVQVLTIESLINLCRMKPALIYGLSPELRADIQARLKWAG